MSPANERQRRHDPGRRDRIVETAMAVIVRDGLSGLSHRKVAAAADVPLGSITYQFASLDELAEEAFARYVARCSDHFEQALAASRSADELPRILAAEVGVYLASGDQLILAYELYLGSVRNPALRKLMNRWLRNTRGSLSRYLDEATARIVDGLIEGLLLHTLLEDEPMQPAELESAFRRLLGKSPA
ncbi:TetR family transcriptional regulator [Luteolibacter flavescens]|uniref:TetR family transcriptional regulator n=1 Tax=Luteolibacter flavescens TaxID=1859460 RepID=A0ABT3FML5_9BACT|nr:TetR family transcriptional regulator [Luteolibacter flavescens]MCW1884810.1 TetR family transcriptional regulator [Luteolibacter flavescens]